MLIAGGILIVLGVAGIGLALGLFISPGGIFGHFGLFHHTEISKNTFRETSGSLTGRVCTHAPRRAGAISSFDRSFLDALASNSEQDKMRSRLRAQCMPFSSAHSAESIFCEHSCILGTPNWSVICTLCNLTWSNTFKSFTMSKKLR